MLTIKYADHRGSESVYPDVCRTSWHEGRLTGELADGGTVTFGPNYRHDDECGGPFPLAYVMNERGATVARYEFYAQSWPDEILAQCQADPVLVEAAKLAA